jgi:hypothetical protein
MLGMSTTKAGPGSGGGGKSSGGSGVRRLHRTELVRGYPASRIGMWFCFLAINERLAREICSSCISVVKGKKKPRLLLKNQVATLG